MGSDLIADAKTVRDTIDGLINRIAALEDLIGLGDDDVTLIILATGLTKQQAKIVSALRKRRVVLSSDMLNEALYGGRPDCDRPTSETFISVQISQARRRLRQFGVAITTVNGIGYTMDAKSRDSLTGLMNCALGAKSTNGCLT